MHTRRRRRLSLIVAMASVLVLAAQPALAAFSPVSVTKVSKWPTPVSVTAPCGNGKHVTFGGFKTNTDLSVNHAWGFPDASAPIGTDVDKWSVKGAAEFVGKDSTFTSIAYCSTGAKPTVVRGTKTAPGSTEGRFHGRGQLPAGEDAHRRRRFSASGRVIVVGLERAGTRAWQVSVISREDFAIKVTAVAVCGGGAKPVAVEQRVLVKENAPNGGTATAECPTGKQVVFAGLRAEYKVLSGKNALPTGLWRPTAKTVRATAVFNGTAPDFNQSSELVAIAYCR